MRRVGRLKRRVKWEIQFGLQDNSAYRVFWPQGVLKDTILEKNYGNSTRRKSCTIARWIPVLRGVLVPVYVRSGTYGGTDWFQFEVETDKDVSVCVDMGRGDLVKLLRDIARDPRDICRDGGFHVTFVLQKKGPKISIRLIADDDEVVPLPDVQK